MFTKRSSYSRTRLPSKISSFLAPASDILPVFSAVSAAVEPQWNSFFCAQARVFDQSQEKSFNLKSPN